MIAETKKKTTTKKRGRPAGKKAKKAVSKPNPKPAVVVKKAKPKKNYIFSVGRRKSAIARVRIHRSGDAGIIVNEKDFKAYFPYPLHWQKLEEPLKLTGELGKLYITIKVVGGGQIGQAESCRLGIARGLEKKDPETRKALKHNLLLRRDSRVKERKKYGLKRARKSPQWAKR
ncbi:30S ribosomal protein S9 [Patescibacteria group bacterium]|nr:30S ribosomal protein S9 [Patescibacteria group bacterium]